MTVRRGPGRLAGLLGLVVLLTTGAACTDRSAGTDLPQIRLTTLDGDGLALGGQRDAPVLVAFFAINNPLALTALDHLQTFAERLGPATVELAAIALSGERPELVRTVIHDRGYLFPVAMDPDGSAATAFGGITVTPTVFLVSGSGRIEARQEGATELRELSVRMKGR